MFTHAILRRPGADFAAGLTTQALGRPDFARMLTQHDAYATALRSVGLTLEILEALPGFPDAYFVEDAALLFPELAIVTRPGAAARRGEEVAMEPAIARHRPLARINEPGTLDGGDVLVVERTVFVGLSDRTNAAGADQLGRLLHPFGYRVVPVQVGAGLHLKSSVNGVGRRTLLVTPEFADRPELKDCQCLVLPEAEAYAGNTLWINGILLTPSGFPGVRALLGRTGLPVLELDTSEARKMDGGLTCLSLRF